MYRHEWHNLYLNEQLLVRKHEGRDEVQTILPASLHSAFVETCHVLCGHQGTAKTAEQVARRVYFPGWRQCVIKTCRECDVCSKPSQGGSPRRGYMQTMEVPKPMDRLAIDSVGPNPQTPRGNLYTLTAIDYFSRFLIAVPVWNKLAKTIIAALHATCLGV